MTFLFLFLFLFLFFFFHHTVFWLLPANNARTYHLSKPPPDEKSTLIDTQFACCEFIIETEMNSIKISGIFWIARNELEARCRVVLIKL